MAQKYICEPCAIKFENVKLVKGKEVERNPAWCPRCMKEPIKVKE